MLIRDATLADGRIRDVRIVGETIAAVGEDLAGNGEVIEAEHRRLLPGMIDAHVHFRDPGFPAKETWATGSRSAAAGGVTTVVDQPNTDPPTVDRQSFQMKAEQADACIVDYGINGGVTDAWQPQELFEQPITALGEVFLADSTGEMGIETDQFADAVAQASDNGIPVTVHAEDAGQFDVDVRHRSDAAAWSDYRPATAEIDAIRDACRVATEHDTQIHIAHTSTPEGVDIAVNAGMTCEVTPHHLLLSRDDLEDLGTFGRMNPPLRSEARREKLVARLIDGTVDIVATDHAPHTRGEKDASIWEAPSGVPGVETALPVLLEEARRGTISYQRVRDVTAANVAARFNLPQKGRIQPGCDADLVLVTPEKTGTIQAENLHSKCGWTPFEGWPAVFPDLTMVRGQVVYRDGEFTDVDGENVRS